jgi:hypothetical protein
MALLMGHPGGIMVIYANYYIANVKMIESRRI